MFLVSWLKKTLKFSGTAAISPELVDASRLFFVVSLSLVSLFLFFRGGATAFEWPAMDMATFWSRYFDPTFALGDFFTDASMRPNPRWVFGLFVAMTSEALGVHWYAVVFAVRVFQTAFTPAVIFWALCMLLKGRLSPKGMFVSQAFLALGVGMSLFNAVNYSFALAYWHPVVMKVQPESFSLLLSFLGMGIFVSALPRRWRDVTSVVLVFIATLVHPVSSLGVFLFFMLAGLGKRNWKDFAALALLGLVPPMMFLQASFSPDKPLSGSEFNYHYIRQNHNFHYLPSNFGSATGIPWEIVFGFVFGALLFIGFLAIRRKKRDLAVTAWIFAAALSSYLILEYLFVELYPVKLFSILTPVRFMSMGYWMLAMAVAWHAGEVCDDQCRIADDLSGRRRRGLMRKAFILLWLTTVGFLAVVGRDDPWGRYKGIDPSFTDWMAEKTSPGDVFVTTEPPMAIQISTIHNRAAFMCNGFPFREDEFIAYNERKDEIFWSYEEWERLPKRDRQTYWVWTKGKYLAMTPQDFVRLEDKYGIDYVIVEKEYAAEFLGFPVEFDNGDYLIYKVDNFR